MMSPWLLNLFINGVVREVNARVLGRGLKLFDADDRMWELSLLLFADDTVFVVRQVCEKYLGKGKDVYFAFMDLEKAYDRVDRNALWKVLMMYGVGGRLLRAVKSCLLYTSPSPRDS